jgi:hypothetical protein
MIETSTRTLMTMTSGIRRRAPRRLSGLAALVVGSQLLTLPIGAAISAAGAAGATTTSALPTCGPHQLAVSVTNGLAGAGHSSWVILVRNQGRVTCDVKGYPDVSLLNAQGADASEATESPTGFTGGLPAGASLPTVELRHGEVASAVMEGTDVPEGAATTCPSFPAYTITLPGMAWVVHIDHVLGSCSGLYVHPFVIGFNGTFPSGDVIGRAPPCRSSVTDGLGPFVQVQALSGSSLAGMVTVASSSKGRQPFQIILKPGRYTIRSARDRSVEHVAVQAGQSTQLGTYGSCTQVTSVPTTSNGLGRPGPTTSTTSP